MAESTEKTPMLKTYFKAGASDASQELQPQPKLHQRLNRRFITLAIAILVLLVAIVIIAVVLAVVLSRDSSSSSTSESLVDSVNSEELLQALRELQETSIDNSRSVLNGYNNSAEYVFKELEDNGYSPYKQYFTVPVFENLRPNEAVFRIVVEGHNFEFAETSQFNVMTYSGSCDDCTGELVSVMEEGDNNYGCDGDLDNVEDSIVLMTYNDQKGCSLYFKAENAFIGGAKAVIFGRDEGDTNGPPASRVYDKTATGEIRTVDIPAIGVTAVVASQLMNYNATVQVTISTYTRVTEAITYNVFARTESGTNESTIVVGSHLDSVPPGPGINDNGSGSMANLRLAISLKKLGKTPKNQILFAWWGAEELGLLGSTYYVAQLSELERSGIALNLNFDMIASPNYIRGIYNGSSADEEILAASTTIQDLFIQYFETNELAYDIVPFTGRSDYGPFIEVNIPAGGLFTGAELLKTKEQYEAYGGIVNAPLDPCYHKFCDNIQNIAADVFEDMTRAAAYVIETLFEQDDLREYLENGINI
ncbi:PREDICTED: leucine aminopeptidase 2-like [Amphimedon queenslandica]|uniref:Peptidase M28 domain-containing protein n=1 Tax=Amphimedon queenslandica TaxID=400682 RepID=A0A1X7UN38_AMPQE|nr:PREDICTED: leucine aminopeptidase 2-like [Amphimedon queenslandica]|eukprot:XP_019853158.1 PREDICTED: leucine aminopeptidase 2-like [Amphimedon queenslandica]